MPPSKNACGSSPVHFSPPRPRLQKRLYASHLQFCKFRALSAVFFVPVVLHTHFSSNFYHIFWKFAPRPRWQAWFWKLHACQIFKNVPYCTPNWPNKCHVGSTYCNSKFAKSIGKMCISCLRPLLDVHFMCYLPLHVCWPCSLHLFRLKFASEEQRTTNNTRISSSCGRRFSSACFISPTWNCFADHK